MTMVIDPKYCKNIHFIDPKKQYFITEVHDQSQVQRVGFDVQGSR